MNLFATSDSHFTHERIIGYCNRPFTSVEEMDEALVERWNVVVRPQDHVYHIGDVAMKKPHLAIVKRLNGHKRLVMGNHDIFDAEVYLEAGFEKVMGIRVFDKKMTGLDGGLLLTHIPVHADSMGRFAANVHGHVHNSTALSFPYINLSVEVTNYTPVALDEIIARVRAA
jgi:calcineurin-like phosphoesterase family protein